MASRDDRIDGVLLATAAGDALGAPPADKNNDGGVLAPEQRSVAAALSRVRLLRLEKYVDVWRSLNPKAREYKWYTKRKNKELHCIEALSRTPGVAALHGARLKGVSADEALQAIGAVRGHEKVLTSGQVEVPAAADVDPGHQPEPGVTRSQPRGVTPSDPR